jgi:hypothetical protein
VWRAPSAITSWQSLAGYRFAKARTRHPGVSAKVPSARTASISGGVIDSCPSQNGQPVMPSAPGPVLRGRR